MPSIPQLIFLALVIAISAYAGRLLAFGLFSRSWPATPGTITTSRIDKASFSGTGHSQFRSVLTLKYSYTVEGRKFTGSRIAAAPNGWFSVGTTASLHEQYHLGADVQVFYSRAKPARCLLERGLPGRLWSFYAVAGLFVFLGLISLINLVRALLGFAA
ncbi:MAG: DUF3592 domain-containing protein [bacterium]